MICPYCQHKLRRVPKERCPHCKQRVLLKLDVGDTEPKLVTDWQAHMIDLNWQIYAAEKNGCNPPGLTVIKLEIPKPERPLITLSGNEILEEIRRK